MSPHHIILVVLLTYLAVPVTVAMIASAKRRSVFWAFVMGLLLPPLAILYYLAVPKRELGQ